MEVLAGKSFSFCFVFEGVGRDNKDKGQGGGNKVCKRGDFFFRGRRIYWFTLETDKPILILRMQGLAVSPCSSFPWRGAI